MSTFSVLHTAVTSLQSSSGDMELLLQLSHALVVICGQLGLARLAQLAAPRELTG